MKKIIKELNVAKIGITSGLILSGTGNFASLPALELSDLRERDNQLSLNLIRTARNGPIREDLTLVRAFGRI